MNTHRAVSAVAVFAVAAALGLGAGKSALQAVSQVFVTNSASAPVPVKPLNTSLTPVYTRDVFNETINGHQAFLNLTFPVNQTTITGSVTVPNGYRFVVRGVSAQGQSAAGNEYPTALYVTARNSSTVHANWGGLFTAENGSTANSLLAAETYFFGESGDSITVTCHRINFTNTAIVNVTLSGYYIRIY